MQFLVHLKIIGSYMNEVKMKQSVKLNKQSYAKRINVLLEIYLLKKIDEAI